MTEAGPLGTDRARSFRWSGIDAEGAPVGGEERAATAFDARCALRAQGIVITGIEAMASSGPNLLAPFTETALAWARSRHRPRKIDLFDALATLMRSGAPLDGALTSLEGSALRSAVERRMLRRVRDDVRGGLAFSSALARHPRWFEEVDVALVQAGLESGGLSESLERLAKHHQALGRLGHRLAVSLAYPTVLLAAAIGVLIYLSQSTLPRLAGILAQSRQEVPPLTRAVMTTGDAIATWWLAFLAVGAGGWWAWRMVRRGRVARMGAARVARIEQVMWIAGFARQMAILLRAGITLPEAMGLSARTIASTLSSVVAVAQARVLEGEDLSRALVAAGMRDPEFIAFIQTGEASGELPTMLEQTAERYQRAAQALLDRLTALIGPVATVVMAVLIGLIVMSTILPLVRLGDAL